ncbi:MAG: CsbD family protein [Acidimicrobiales bacterium]
MPGRRDETAGRVKRAAGKVSGNRKLEGEGRAQEATGKAKRKTEEVKDTVKGAVRGVRESRSRK